MVAIKVLLFGSSKRDYAQVQVKGLIENGVEVDECSAPIKDFSDNIEQGKVASKKLGVFKIARFVTTLLLNYIRLITRHRKKKYDIMLLNTGGFYNFPLARLLSRIRKKPLVYSAWVSVFDVGLERKAFKENSFKGRLIFRMEKRYLKKADLVICETEMDRQWFCKTFNLNFEKVKVINVGCDDHTFSPKNIPSTKEIVVLFIGIGQPLQGIEYVLKARELLKGNSDIKFRLIGPFKGSDESWVPYNMLADEINRADICLGLFGTTDRTRRYIANKVFFALACAKPIISADTPAMREAFIDEMNCLMTSRGNADAIADAILRLCDKSMREKIAKAGYELYKQRFTPNVIGQKLKNILEEIYTAKE